LREDILAGSTGEVENTLTTLLPGSCPGLRVLALDALYHLRESVGPYAKYQCVMRVSKEAAAVARAGAMESNNRMGRHFPTELLPRLHVVVSGTTTTTTPSGGLRQFPSSDFRLCTLSTPIRLTSGRPQMARYWLTTDPRSTSRLVCDVWS